MPTISCSLCDLNQLAGTSLDAREVEKKIVLVKGEIKGYDPDTDELKVELQDTNRPDLWTVEGIARQLRYALTDSRRDYPCFTGGKLDVAGDMYVDKRLHYRPFAGAIAVQNIDVTDELLIGMIQTQEKLANNLGRHRKSLSIGIYDLDQVHFPVYYKSTGRNDVKFVPLECNKAMTPAEILETHPKGIEYASILEGQDEVPLLIDSSNNVMSFPPIINSRTSGEVQTGNKNLFIEATGTNLMHLVLALNIIAADMTDRGGEIQRVNVHFEEDTQLGKQILMPFRHRLRNMIDTEMVSRWLGMQYTAQEMADLLYRYGYHIENKEKTSLTVSMPDWRHDLLHPVDIMEDLAIIAGYDSFTPEMPSYFTVGKISEEIAFEDRIRDNILAFGYEEVVSNILCSNEEFAEMVREPDRKMVEIDNPMNIKFAALRDRILPSLLRVERDSSQAVYPHKIFETGEVTVFDHSTDTGCRTRIHLAVLIADKEAEFSNCHSCLESLLYSLNTRSVLVQQDAPIFLPGRSAKVTINGNELGWIGEIHPEVLEIFGIVMPCSAFEIDLDSLRETLSEIK
jgi:phenylalanyl-tRNA synthetase beta chain